ncbi:DUF2490 domain-containing protein [Foetidibacter luteolus]|uniref:DUF2490 domain-containing protein n=1 Tax=Foetidibacter luteolus TaxID=2608880 RepID=UPI001A991959|nr:DUF2490 domain-containing protein [Foetidibacter luteolus]
MKKTFPGKTVLILLFTLLTAIIANAQNTKATGGWYVANLMYKPDSSWNFFFETQTRSQNVTDVFFYHEFKGGIAYNILKKHQLLLGFGDYKTYSSTGNYKTPMLAKEFRIWQQLTINNNIDRVKIDHRYRIEQRWLNGDFRSRFRYRLNPLIPVNKKKIETNAVFVSVFDEVFFGNLAPYFERNRFFMGLGYVFSKSFSVQSGWIRQYDYRKADDGSGKNFFQTTLFFSLDRSNEAREWHPGNID